VKGISKSKSWFYRERNFKIYEEYLNTSITMEALAKKYAMTKQRIWQIIRRCQVGQGDYYQGYQTFKAKKESFEGSGLSEEEVHHRMRMWLSETHGVKTIKLKDE
jgi:predicted DNA-binding protein YlxM (UPF0122 family)